MFQCDCPPDDCAGRVRLYLLGERCAGDALVRKFTPLVQSVVQRVLGPSRRAHWEDACQTIFLRLFSNLGKWGERCPFCKWLAVLAARRAIDLARLSDPARDALPVEEVPDSRPPPPDRETLEKIERLVALFPPEWRRVWDDWAQGVPREVMAQRAGKSLRTVQYWLAEMLDQLREGLGEG
jgi:DNA-directed RNA polymerase specialized sigma24 family protein